MNIMYKLRDWIDVKKLYKYFLMENPNKFMLYDKYPELIDWKSMSYDEKAIPILLMNIDKIDWKNLQENMNSIKIYELYM